jgi:hypothetical protein
MARAAEVQFGESARSPAPYDDEVGVVFCRRSEQAAHRAALLQAAAVDDAGLPDVLRPLAFEELPEPIELGATRDGPRRCIHQQPDDMSGNDLGAGLQGQCTGLVQCPAGVLRAVETDCDAPQTHTHVHSVRDPAMGLFAALSVQRWDDHDGTGGVVDDLLAHGPEEEAGEPAAPAGARDEQVGALGGVEEGACGGVANEYRLDRRYSGGVGASSEHSEPSTPTTIVPISFLHL